MKTLNEKEDAVRRSVLSEGLCRTDLVEKLLTIRRRAIENGMKLLNTDEINDLVAEERQGRGAHE